MALGPTSLRFSDKSDFGSIDIYSVAGKLRICRTICRQIRTAIVFHSNEPGLSPWKQLGDFFSSMSNVKVVSS